MSTNVAGLSTNFFPSPQNGFSTTLASTVSAGATTVPLNSVAGFSNGDVAVLVVDPANSSKQTFTGVVDTAGVQLTSVVWTAGTNVSHLQGATVTDYATATHIAMMAKGLLKQHVKDGTHGAVTATSVSTTGGITAGNGLTATGAVSLPTGSVASTSLTNPYKFRVYRAAALNSVNGTAAIAFDTKSYDTGSNVDIVTNKGRFTAPVAGFYQLTARASAGASPTLGFISLYRNASELSRGSDMRGTSSIFGSTVTDVVQLAANDFVEAYWAGSGTNAFEVGSLWTYFSGYLVSAALVQNG